MGHCVGPYSHPGPSANPKPTPTRLYSSPQHINHRKHPQTPFRDPQQLLFCVFCVLYTHHTLQVGLQSYLGAEDHPDTDWGGREGHNVSFCLFFIKFTYHHRVCGVSVVTSLSPTDLPGTRCLSQTHPLHPPYIYYTLPLLWILSDTTLKSLSGPR